MGGPTPLTGPDLSAGVPRTSIEDGAVLRGHTAGQAVIVSNVDGRYYAVGATCTHYSGPLDEGIRVGGTVRCPWHHACFDLRTGEPLRAPALRPLARYDVVVEGDVVRVPGTTLPSEAPRRRAGPESVVVVGGGAAGAAAVVALRRLGYGGPITLVGREPNVPTDRPNVSKDFLAGNAPAEWMPIGDEEFYRERDVTLRLGSDVVALDPGQRRVQLADGTSIGFGACLLATGADPIRLPIPGADSPNVFTVRTIDDGQAILDRLPSSKRAVVVGASFIGLEVAASLRARGLEVHVVAPEARPLERILGPAWGAFLQELHEKNGVVFHLGRTPGAIERDGVLLSDGSRLAADLVVLGVGVRPSIALAERAGLQIADKGVVVDSWLRTSAPSVWAAGDIARWPDPHTGEPQRIEHFVLAQRHAQAAADNILGAEKPFDGIPFFWSAHYDATINVAGFLSKWDRVDVDGDLAGRDAAVAYRRGDRTVAVATIGRDRTSLEAERLLEQNDQKGLQALVRG
jgi:NADPH-dependent 2,4-dienoyl-CoA reductase/sulfur reductase-like enzyme/nitrite reductase/ring-hydroxylating ferredoxin subunit